MQLFSTNLSKIFRYLAQVYYKNTKTQVFRLQNSERRSCP